MQFSHNLPLAEDLRSLKGNSFVTTTGRGYRTMIAITERGRAEAKEVPLHSFAERLTKVQFIPGIE